MKRKTKINKDIEYKKKEEVEVSKVTVKTTTGKRFCSQVKLWIWLIPYGANVPNRFMSLFSMWTLSWVLVA